MQISWIQLSDYKTTLQMNKDINMRKIVPRKKSRRHEEEKETRFHFFKRKGQRKLQK